MAGLLEKLGLVDKPRATELRGWRISYWRDEKRSQNVWSAKRHGVSMNTNSYEGIVTMILDKECLQ